MDRRTFLQTSALAGGTLVAARAAAQHEGHGAPAPASVPPLAPAPAPARNEPARRPAAPGGQVAVHTPNGVTLPWKTRGRLKIGHLVAMSFQHEFAPGLSAEVWGYNGHTPGPTIEAVEGDTVRIYVTNRLPEPTTVHWHGLFLPNGMDGVSGLNQHPIPPGQTFCYEFPLIQSGTFMYHPHFDEMTQMALGMVGMFIVHPRRPVGPRVDRDFVLMTHEWSLAPGAKRPDPNEMKDFNLLTFNSKAFPGTEPLLVRRGDRVRLRFGNLSAMDHHPIHLHGYAFEMTATDGGTVPPSARYPETTVLVPVGATRVVEFVADQLGDWAMHCHMTHHIMTQMGHGLPVMVGADAARIDQRVQAVLPEYMTMGHDGMGAMAHMDMPFPENSLPMRGTPGPFGTIDMGGMFTVLKVRAEYREEDRAGWYAHPEGTVAKAADGAQMAADGVDPAALFEG